MKARLVVLISGTGTNLQAIIDACANGLLPAEIVHVFSNRMGAKGLERASNANIPTTLLTWNKNVEARCDYDHRLGVMVQKWQPTLVVLAGWMHLLSQSFLSYFKEGQVINLHPALPGQFPGAHAIEEAYYAPNATHSGVMVHTVVEEMDAGQTIAQLGVAKFASDTLDQFKARIQQAEKTVLLQAIGLQISIFEQDSRFPRLLYRGKVRDVYEFGYGLLLMLATDRCSCFDRHVCNIPHKGNVLNRLSVWWFNRTRHIIPNHMIWSDQKFSAMVVKRCRVFSVEFVVRGYITGSTNTAMWTLYSAGTRQFNGVQVPNGLRKNQQLAEPIVTPTTKSTEHDMPITATEIIEQGLMTAEEYAYCHAKALELFKFGQLVASERNLLLVDTKYEFGSLDSQILLIDELHTCDSSRYWKRDTYQECFNEGIEPQRFDKDMIRLFITSQPDCDPYDAASPLPEVPEFLTKTVSSVYIEFLRQLCGDDGAHIDDWPLNDVALASLRATYYRDCRAF